MFRFTCFGDNSFLVNESFLKMYFSIKLYYFSMFGNNLILVENNLLTFLI